MAPPLFRHVSCALPWPALACSTLALSGACTNVAREKKINHRTADRFFLFLPEQFRDAQGHRARSVPVQPPGGQAEAQGGRWRDLRRVERGAHGHRERVPGRGDVQLRPVYHAEGRAGI